MTTIIARDPSATDEFCFFLITTVIAGDDYVVDEHTLLDIADHDDITEADLIAQARAQGVDGDLAIAIGVL